MEADLFWIPGPWRGRLAITARPRGGDWLDDEAVAWRHAGVDGIVSLLEQPEADQLELAREGEAVQSQGIHFASFPIPDRGVPASIQDTIAVVADIASRLQAGKNVAVHCRQGIGRSGLVAAGVLMSAGLPADEAIRTVSEARGVPVPETGEQRRWIEQLRSSVPVA